MKTQQTIIKNGRFSGLAWQVANEIVNWFNNSKYSKNYTIESYGPMGLRGAVPIYIRNKENEQESYSLKLSYKNHYIAYDTKEKYPVEVNSLAEMNGLNMDNEYLPVDFIEILKLFKNYKNKNFEI